MKCSLSIPRVPRDAVLALAVAASAAAAGFALPATALAASDSVGTISYYKSGSEIPHLVVKTYTNCDTLASDAASWASTKGVTKVIVSVDKDWNTSKRIDLPADSNVLIRLNGHMINRGLANTSFGGSNGGEVIKVGKNSTLTIEGGDTSTKHMGKLTNNSTFWHSDLTGGDAISGGLITGGAGSGMNKSGGAITTGNGKVKLVLNNVTIAGNVADTYDGGNGCGGGIFLLGDNSELELNASSICYNRAQDDGGGIFVDGNDCKVTLAGNSTLRGNSADGDGGGMYHNGKKGTVTLKEKSDINGNVATNGGGIYDYYNYTTYELTDSFISYNVANGAHMSFTSKHTGAGGGIHLNDDSDVKLHKGSKIWHNSAKYGGGIYANDDGIELALDGGSLIQSNTASEDGGGIYTYDSTAIKLDNSKITENTAKNGGGVFESFISVFWSSAQTDIELKNNAEITYNKATAYGGGVYLSSASKFTTTIKSPDETGYVGNNSAYGSSAIYAGNDALIKGLTIKNNTSSAVAGVTLASSSSLDLAGKNIIEDNYTGGKQVNVYMQTYSTLTSVKGDAPSAESSIGITMSDNCDDGDQIVYDDEAVAKLAAYPSRAIHRDDPSKSFRKDGKDLYISNAPSSFTVKIATADGNVISKQNSYNSTVELKSSDYAKAGSTLAYWKVTGLAGVDAYKPSNGAVRFTMPANDVGMTPVYTTALSYIELNLSDSATWDQLGADASSVEVSSLRLAGADDSSYGITTTAAIRTKLKVAGVKAESTDSGKKVTYTVELDPAVFENYGLYYDSALYKDSNVEARASFGTKNANDIKVTQNSEGKLVVEATVPYTTPVKAVIVNTVNLNKTDAEPFDTVVEELKDEPSAALVLGAGEEEANTDTVTIEVPDEPGWSFSEWKNLPDDAVVDATTGTVTMPRLLAESTQLTALYEPLASAIAIEMDVPKAGEAFPSEISSCTMSGANERDLTKYLAPLIKVTWTLADGMPAGDVAQAGTIYKVKLVANGSEFPYVFGMDSSVRTTVNGSVPYSCEYDGGSKTGSITYYVKIAEDESFANVLDDAPVVAPNESAVMDALPNKVQYLLNSGELKVAVATWDAKSLEQISSLLSLYRVDGSFVDEAGDEHAVSQTVVVTTEPTPIEGAVMSLNKYVWAYAKSGCKPTVTVTLDGKKLTKGVDCKLSYTNFKKAGIAYVSVVGMGDYAGIKSDTLAYVILPAKVADVKAKSTAKHKATVYWAKHKAQTDGFQIRYALNKAKLTAGKGKTVKVKGAAKTSRALKSLKSGKKIYVQVRAYKKATDGVTYCSDWSKVKAVKVK